MDAERFARDLSAFPEEDRRRIQMIEKELDIFLAVEPPPHFAARVGERIREQERPARRWSLRWSAAAAIVLAVAAAVALTTAWRSGSGEQPRVTHAVEPVATRTPLHGAASSEQAGPSHVRLDVPTPALREHRIHADFEVLVPPDQRIAIARVLEMGRTGALDERALSPDGAVDDAPAEPVSPIVVDGLQVPLIDVAAGSVEKAHQQD